MPRLTAPFLLSRPINYSPLSLREIDLRSSSIPNIENLMVLLDQLDSYDLTDNDVQIFENMPVLKRCKEISLANNTITKIQPDLAARVPSLTILNLSTNSLKSLASIVPLLSLNTLTHLDLTNNACCNKKYYRLLLIGSLTNLRVLDYARVTAAERAKSSAFMKSKIGEELLAKIKSGQTSDAAVEEEDDAAVVKAVSRTFTDEEKKKIKDMILNAKDAKEVDTIQEAVKRGVMPVVDSVEKVEEKVEKEELLVEEKVAPLPKKSAPKKRQRSDSNASAASTSSKTSARGKRSRANSTASTQSTSSKSSKKASPKKKAKTSEEGKMDYSKLTVAKLKEVFKERGVDVPKGKKADLVKALEEIDM